jgi:hypothetical protein
VLAGVLLHVIAAARIVYCAGDGLARRERRRGEVVNPAIIIFGNFTDWYFDLIAGKQFAGIVYLPAAGGVKSSAVEHDSRLPFPLRGLDHARLEVIEK